MATTVVAILQAMKFTLVAAVSQNGYITDGSNPSVTSWTSAEDKTLFSKIKNQHKLFVMGKNTYEAAEIIAQPGTLRVILTSNPAEYEIVTVEGQLEFHDLSAQAFVERYQDMHESCLVLGGSIVYNDFLKAGLISEAIITVEPLWFESGIGLTPDRTKLEEFGLEIAERKQLNSAGTELMTFKRK